MCSSIPEKSIKHFIDSTADIVFIKNLNHEYIEFNNNFEAFLGKSTEDIKGHTDFDFFKADEAKRFQELYDKIVREKISNESTVYFEEKSKWFSTVKTPFLDDDGNVIGIIGIARDVTVQKEAELLIVEKDHLLKGLFAGLKQGWAVHEIVTNDCGEPVDYVFLDMNDEFENMTGLRRNDIIGKSVKTILPETEDKWIIQYGQVALTGNSVLIKDFSKALNKSYEAYAFKTKHRQFAVMVIDVTEQKAYEENLIKAKEEAERMNNAKDRFLSNMSHEMRTPVNGILGLIALMQTTKLSKEQMIIIDKMKSSADVLARLFDSIFLYSSLEPATEPEHHISIKTLDALKEVCKKYRDIAKLKGVDMTYELQTSFVARCAFESSLVVALLEILLDNALKFTERGSIHASVGLISAKIDSHHHLAITVKDTGIGIAKEHFNTIFQPFAQMDDSISKHYPGLGMGLGIVKRATSQFGGDIHLESEEGVGTQLTIQLPVHHVSLGGGDKKHSAKGYVLVVEGDLVTQIIIEKYLKRHSFKVILAVNVVEMFIQLKQQSVDCVFINDDFYKNDAVQTALLKVPICVYQTPIDVHSLYESVQKLSVNKD